MTDVSFQRLRCARVRRRRRGVRAQLRRTRRGRNPPSRRSWTASSSSISGAAGRTSRSVGRGEKTRPGDLLRHEGPRRRLRAALPRPRERDRLHDRPVAQRRGKARRDAPVGDEHPNGVRKGVARRHSPPHRAAPRRRRARRAPRAARGVRDRRAAAPHAATGVARSRPRPVEAFRSQGHRERLASERGTTTAASSYESG